MRQPVAAFIARERAREGIELQPPANLLIMPALHRWQLAGDTMVALLVLPQ